MAMKQRVKPSVDAVVEPARGKGPTKGKTPPRLKASKGQKLKARGKATAAPAHKPVPVEAGGWPELGPQRPARRAASRPSERYLRLQIRVENGELSVVDSHVVDGPLAQSSTFEGRFAYEVSEGGRLLHAGSIPDLGVMRSFAHPNGTLEQRGHHTYELPHYHFHVRVPLGALTRAAAAKVDVVLYRVKEHPPSRAALAHALTTEPLGTQMDRELREVGRLEGLPSWILEPKGRRTAPGVAKKR